MLRALRGIGGAVPRLRARRKLQSFLVSTVNCRDVQRETLRRILALNAASDFSRERGLSASLDVASFRQQVTIGDFETIRPYVERLKAGDSSALLGPRNRLLMFTLSSGTTSDSKYIPITSQFLADYRHGWQSWGIRAMDAHPRLHKLDILQLASDYDQFRTPGGIPCGNISGLVGAMQNPIVRQMYAAPQAITRIRDAEAKQYATLRIAAANRHVGLVMTANPSTLIQLARLADRECETLIRDLADGTCSPHFEVGPVSGGLRRRLTQRDRRRARELERAVERTGHLYPAAIWPALTLVGVWTGGSAGAYLETMRPLYGNVPVRDHGLSASEGRMTIPIEDETSGGILDIGSHYFEFIPEAEHGQPNPTVLEAHELEPGQDYYILLTTLSGLYRYDIRDVVRCTGFYGTTPTLEFLHKGAHIANLTGEKLSESQIVSAVRTVSRRRQLDLGHFTVAPVWGDPPRYRLHVESTSLPDEASWHPVLSEIDHELQQLNCEYQDKRQSTRLALLEGRFLPNGTWGQFARLRQSKVGGSVEQYKHPCLIPDLQFSDRLWQDHAVPILQSRGSEPWNRVPTPHIRAHRPASDSPRRHGMPRDAVD